MSATKTLADVILAGWAAELDYMTTDEQADALENVDYLHSCDEDEIADAADFIALSLAAPKWS